LHYIGPKDQYSGILLQQENIKVHNIASGKLRRYFSFRNFVDILFTIPFGFLQSFFLLISIRPKLVLSKGGSGSLVAASAARTLGIPVFLHESDSVPGLSNQKISAYAKKIFISFPKTEYFDLEKTLLTGHPILKELTEGSKESAKDIFHLNDNLPVVLFWGGSQGAEPINDFVINVLPELLGQYQIIHVCGKKNFRTVQEESKVMLHNATELEKNYHVLPFLEESQLKHAFAIADLVVSRAGAGSIFELAGAGKPAIIIPLPSSAGNHQSKNAYQYAASGGAIVIEQDNLIPNFFMEKIRYLLSDPKELEHMKQAALQFAKPLAAKAIAREILEYLHVQ
jgi:UDP-N-acetylglucosamine--N-acetylmuramyl-(pentapeptide) pyrophosphoryl-undecaprenol N-acetylglucosamine transferase